MLRSVVALLAVTALAGCSEFGDQLTGRYGPSPVPTAVAVQNAVERQTAVVLALAQGTAREPPVKRLDWYNVTLTGFNVVEDACMTYIDDLWILERRKARTGALITATGAAVAEVIAANANPSATTLAILAQAFGLASAFNTTISDSYLYSQNAATIKKLVQKTTDAYRTDYAANFGRSEWEYPMASPAAAYHHMREYLSLCLPPTIQAQIEDMVAKAQAGPQDSPKERSAVAARTAAAQQSGRGRSATTSITLY